MAKEWEGVNYIGKMGQYMMDIGLTARLMEKED